MRGHVTAVASGKGGVGKTTTVINLAVSCRMNEQRVAVVDGDLAMPNLAECLGIEAEATLHDVLAGTVTVDDAIVETAEGFGLLVGDRSLDRFAAIDPGGFDDVIEALAERYDHVLVDTGAGLNYENALTMSLADSVVLVTTPDEAAVENTKRTAELARGGGIEVRGAVLTRVDGDVDRDGIEAVLGTAVLGTVPEDAAVSETTGAGKPLEIHAPDSDAAATYRRLADVLDDIEDDHGEDREAGTEDSAAEGERDGPIESGDDHDREDADVGPESAGEPRDEVEGEGDDSIEIGAEADPVGPGDGPVEGERGAGEANPMAVTVGGDDGTGTAESDDGETGRFSRVVGLFR